jgi:hypothetical protein
LNSDSFTGGSPLQAKRARQNSEDNFLDLTLLTGALYCAAAVCRSEFPPEKRSAPAC